MQELQRFRGGDAQFLYSESATSPFVTLKAMIYEPVEPGSKPTIDEIKAFIAAGVADWIYRGLGYRVVRAPFDLHHPLWVKDKNFCLDKHIHHIALPEPGDKDKLCEFISNLMSAPLDPNRPLWNSWIVEGLEGGRIAWVCKMHHVLADGLMSAEHIINIHSDRGHNPDAAGLATSDYVFKGSPDVPGRGKLFWLALVDLIKTYTYEFPRYRREYKEAKSHNEKKSASKSGVQAYGPFMAPFTLLNQPGDHYLRYRYESFSLSEFKALSKQLDCSVNNLVLGICSEALRRYLSDFEPLPDVPMVIIMPVSNRKGGCPSQFLNSEFQNNSVSIAFVPLDLNIENFYERLESIKAWSQAAMTELDCTQGTRMDSFADFMPGSFFRFLNWVFSKRQQRKKNPLCNLSISNVPGPREELFACDGRLRMTELLSCGNLGDSASLGLTIWSYVDNLCFSCFFRDDVMPDPPRFTRYLNETYQQIKEEQQVKAASVSNSNNS